MYVVKLFTEGPLLLEALSAEADPDARRQGGGHGDLEALLPGTLDLAPPDALGLALRPPPYYRAYLAGTDLGTGRVGVTALPAEAWRLPLLSALAPEAALAVRGGDLQPLDAAALPQALAQPDGLSAMAWGDVPPSAHVDLREVATEDRRYAIPALRRLLDRGLILLFPEPAHHGHDWSLYAGAPLRDRIVGGFRACPAEGVRRFVAPYQRMRAEHKFYFEQWALDDPPEGVEEVG